MSDGRFIDVRMRGFRTRAAVADVLALLDARVAPLPGEVVPVIGATGRVLAEAVTSPVDVPGFARSAMDGFAVCASDTAGATPDVPRTLTLAGESKPARPFAGEVTPGLAVRIMTGAPVPAGADAVVMAEFAHLEGEWRVRVLRPVAAGKHVVRPGEDVAKGSVILPAGRVMRPQDVGLLASIGAATVSAVRRPRVAILVTGDELLPPGAVPSGYRIMDSNSPMLAVLAARDGAEVLPVLRLRDEFAAIRDAVREATQTADIILLSGGTSVGTEDHGPRVAAELGELAVHGAAIRPGGPLGVAFLPSLPTSHAPLPLFLIPGNPVACLCAYDLFAGRAIRRLGGRPSEVLPYGTVMAALASEITSAAGRVDYVRVKIDDSGRVAPLAAAGASNLSSAVAADGFVLVPHERDRLAPGEVVRVWLY
jgi:molybdopterin molybdotransferase